MRKPKMSFVASACNVLEIEANAISALAETLNQAEPRQALENACDAILACQGRVIVTGMGKSGHIASKIAATLASTGTPAFFVHPGEASHGDLGMITPQDLVLAISNSGETAEVLTIVPIIKRMGVTLIGVASAPKSSLATLADVYLNVPIEQEACPMNLAPTASTTATLALGDALAIAVLNARDFTETDFARSHPGGSLGRRLLLYVEDVMHRGDEVPMVKDTDSISTALVEMTTKGLGMTGVENEHGELVGVYTDGDLRRSLKESIDLNAPIKPFMTNNPVTTRADALAAQVVALMKEQQINGILVCDGTTLVGALNMQDLLRAGVV